MDDIIDYKSLLQPHELLDDDLIRLGSNGDGGYVVPKKAIENCNLLISLGVGTNCSFDLAYINRNKNAKVIFYDGTVDSVPNYSAFRKDSFDFKRENISEENVANILEASTEEYFLKMDIEGGEYSLLFIENPKDVLRNCRCIATEIHWIDDKNNKFANLMRLFELANFKIVHLHGNVCGGTFSYNGLNIPKVIELTFLKKEYVGEKKNSTFPISGLDFANMHWRKDIAIDWYSK